MKSLVDFQACICKIRPTRSNQIRWRIVNFSFIIATNHEARPSKESKVSLLKNKIPEFFTANYVFKYHNKTIFSILIHLCKDFTHIWRITVFKLFSMTCSAIYGQNVQTTIGQKLSTPFNYFTRIFSSFFAVQELNFVIN